MDNDNGGAPPLTIGCTVRYHTWGGGPREARVDVIETCAAGSKYGRSVKRCAGWRGRNGVVDLDDGHWCYFDQIEEVL